MTSLKMRAAQGAEYIKPRSPPRARCGRWIKDQKLISQLLLFYSRAGYLDSNSAIGDSHCILSKIKERRSVLFGLPF